MKVKDKKLKKIVDVSDKNCLTKKCYWPREDPGIFNQGQGYKFRSHDWMCGTREIRGCPDFEGEIQDASEIELIKTNDSAARFHGVTSGVSEIELIKTNDTEEPRSY